jgi:hypothetical protein
MYFIEQLVLPFQKKYAFPGSVSMHKMIHDLHCLILKWQTDSSGYLKPRQGIHKS